MFEIFSRIRNLIPSLSRTKIIVIIFSLILLAVVPLTVIVSQQQQQTKQHASGFEDNPVDAAQNLSQDLNQISSNPTGCGDKCAEEPPVPKGVMTVNYCSKPLTVPKNEVTDTYKSYQNVKKNNDGKDNRYFIYVSKDNPDPVKIKVNNVNDIAIEQLAGDSVSFDGENLTVISSGAFAIHANPARESAIGPCILGAFCSNKDLYLKAEGSKNRMYPSDNCAQLSSAISYIAAQNSVDGDGGTGKGLLYAAMNRVIDKIFEAQADVLGKSAPVSSLVDPSAPAAEKVTVRIDMQIGGDPIPLIDGVNYDGTILTIGGAVQPALEFARGLRGLPTAEAKAAAVDGWIAEHGVFPTDTVIAQLRAGGEFGLADFASKFVQKEGTDSPRFLDGEKTLSSIMGAKLPDGRFICVCADIAVLGAVMLQEAGVPAWPVGGIVPGGGKSYVGLSELKEGNFSGHAWIEFKGSQGKIIALDPIYDISDDLKTPRIHNPAVTSINDLNNFKYLRKLEIPDVYIANYRNYKENVFRLVELIGSDGRTIPHRMINGGIYIEGYGGIENIAYVFESSVTDKTVINKIEIAGEAKGAAASAKFSVSTNSKIPVLMDTGKGLIVLNPELFSATALSGIKVYNEGMNQWLRDRPNTPAGIAEVHIKELRSLKQMIATSGGKADEAIGWILEPSMDKVKQQMEALRPEQKMQVVSDTLATAENSPLKGKGMMSLEGLKANPSKLFAKGVGPGTQAFLLLGGPITMELARSLDNAYLITAVRSANSAGMAQLAVMGVKTAAQVAIAANTAFRTGSTLASKAWLGTKAAGITLGGTAAGLAGGQIMFAGIAGVGTTLFCAANPKSALCGCRISGEYGENKLRLELQKYDVSKGEKVQYRILGFENCPTRVDPVGALMGFVNMANYPAPEPRITTGKDGNSPNPLSGKDAKICKWQPDGRWCLGEFTANLDKGSYKLTILQPQILSKSIEDSSAISGNSMYLYPHDTDQVLSINDGDNVSVKLAPGLTPTPKVSLSPSPTTSVLSPFSTYNQCLVICDQGILVSGSFDKPACIDKCGSDNQQSIPTITSGLKITTAPIPVSPTVPVSVITSAPTGTPVPAIIPPSSFQCFEKCVDEIADVNICQKNCEIPTPTPASALIPTLTLTPVPQSSCPLSLVKADANCDGIVDMNDFNKQKDYRISGQITQEQLTIWTNNIWSPAFLSSQ